MNANRLIWLVFFCGIFGLHAAIETAPGFKVELLHSSTGNEGSWVSMAIDPAGRLIVSPQSEKQLLRFTLTNGQVAKIESIQKSVGCAMGLLWAGDSLLVNGDGPKGLGIYRLRAKGDDFAAPELIHITENNGGEHGSHGMAIGPDNKLYVVNGNFTKVPSNCVPWSSHKNYAEDQLLPRDEDSRGFSVGIPPPGGFVLRMDLDGRNCELFAAGSRNTYAIAFNPDGELFGFDNDMECDVGLSFYRPTRVDHWVSGGDYGFREGTGKFPEYYEDSLPATLRVGLSTPTGIKFGTNSNFPEKYRQALFLLDWSYGRIIAVHLTPEGASYGATMETILRGQPLNLTACEFGRDGAMYFVTGGRGTQAGLYRLSCVGVKIQNSKSKIQQLAEKQGRQARQLRHDLEFFHGKRDPRIVSAVWPLLDNDDRWIRYAARIALEFQDVAGWKDRAISETKTTGGLTALLALARCGGKETQHDLITALEKFPARNLSEEQQLLKLRVIELSFIRQGRPDEKLVKPMMDELDAQYPSPSEPVNRELCQLLLYLKAPDVIEKSLALLDREPTQEDQTYYIMRLRNITNGWTLDQRRHYLAWFDQSREGIAHPAEVLRYFKDLGLDYNEGCSFPQFIVNFRQEAIDSLSETERDALAASIAGTSNVPEPTTEEHKFVHDWKMADVQPDLDHINQGRSFDQGQEAFRAAQCIQCHRFGNSGGSVGPELTAVSTRLGARDILESILEPSKVVSDQYRYSILTLKSGDDITGQIVQENDQKVVVVTDPRKRTKIEITKADVQSRRISALSPMPEGLANILTKDEILDLIAYLESGGKKQYAAFKK